jgi:hypothetical protein
MALQEANADLLDRTAGAIRGRAARVAAVVTAEMDNYEPGLYTERVMEAVSVLNNEGKLVLLPLYVLKSRSHGRFYSLLLFSQSHHFI